MRRTQYLVKILVEEKLPANDFRESHNIYSFSFVSSKHHRPCIGLEKEIRELLWKPFYERYFTGGRYIIDMTARSVAQTKDIKIPKKYRC